MAHYSCDFENMKRNSNFKQLIKRHEKKWFKFVSFILSSIKCNLNFGQLLLGITDSLAKWVERLPMGRETEVQSQVVSYRRLKKMVLGTSLLSTQHYKVHIKGKVAQSRRRSSALSVVAIEKGAFGLPSTSVTNFT